MNTMPLIEDDTDFLALYRAACTMGASILKAGAALTPTAKQALIADLASGDQARAKAALVLMGTSESVIDEQRQLVSNLAGQHPLPKDAAQIQTLVEDAVAAARLSFPDGGGPAPDPLDEIMDELGLPSSGSDEPGSNIPCLNLCKVQAVALAAAALTSYIYALALCTLSGPASVFCAFGATAAYAFAIYQMDAVIDRCVANCG